MSVRMLGSRFEMDDVNSYRVNIRVPEKHSRNSLLSDKDYARDMSRK